MANTQYKKTELAPLYIPASSLAVSDPSPLKREAFATVMRSQDSILGGRRCLVSQHSGGGDVWLVGDDSTGGGTQTKPTDSWRTVCRARTELMPGSVLTARVLAIPSGPPEIFVISSGTYENAGPKGQVRFVIEYDNVDADSDSVTVTKNLPPSGEDDGKQGTDDGWAWSNLQHHAATGIRPGGGVPLEEIKWSEWPTVTVAVEHRAGARVVHASLHEEPHEHQILHTETSAVTCNGVRADQALFSPRPLKEDPDGASFEEHRGGTHRLLYVAARQRERVGPRICHFSAYSEELTEVTDSEANAIQIGSTTPVRVSWRFANANTSWDANAPGFDMPANRTGAHNMSSRLSGAAVSPVRLRVYARYSGAGSAVGFFQVQSSPRSLIKIEISQALVGSSWQWLSASGYLEANIADDDWYAIVQDFAWTSGGTLEIRYWDLSYGAYPVGA